MNPAELIQRITAARDRFRAIRDCDSATSFSGHQAHHGGRELDELIADLQKENQATNQTKKHDQATN